MTIDPVRVASVGLGWWGENLASAGTRAGLEVVSCFARGQTGRDGFAEKHQCRAASSVEELIADDDVEALLLATPHSTHTDLIERAAAAGKHIFVEKPLTLSFAEGRRAVAAADDAGVVLQVGHNRRRQPANRRLKELVSTGQLGTVHYLEANLSNRMNLPPKVGWRGDPTESPGGGMTALGVHMVDTLIYLAGPIAKVSAFSRQLLAHSALDDITTAIVEFESGALGTLTTSMVIPTVARVAVFGTAAAAWNEVDGARLYTQQIDQPERQSEEVAVLDTIQDQLDEFAKSVRGLAAPETGGHPALAVVAVLEALMTSASEGRVVEIAEITAR